jgi:acyl carrier protein
MQAERERERVVAELRGWLAARRPEINPTAIEESTDLIASRILDSLELVEFILYIEELSGAPILSEALDPSHIRTLGAVCARFFEAEHD